jgi:hypothetical protein
LNHEKPKLSEVLSKNRIVVIGILGLPIIGMLIATILLLFKKPENLPIILGVMLFVGIQYIIMIFIFMKRIEQVANKRIEEPIESEKNKLNDKSPQLPSEVRKSTTFEKKEEIN